VVHHGIMPMSGEFPSNRDVLEILTVSFFLFFTVWFGVKFTPGGHSTFFGLLNTAVHIVMYTYYLFAAMGPQYQKFLWWKKYLTGLQMVSRLLRVFLRYLTKIQNLLIYSRDSYKNIGRNI
jgi:GNS1/SUR4 family